MDNTADSYDYEISLLDIAVVIAESWKILILLPLLAGAVAYFSIGFMTPRLFTSEALIQADINQITLLQSARVLNDPIRESSLLDRHGNHLSVARTALIGALDVNKIKDTDIYSVKLTLDSPEEASQLLERIIAKLIQETEPAGHYRETLEIRLESQQESLEDLTTTFARLNEGYSRILTDANGQLPIIQGEIGQSLATLISNIEAKRLEISQTTQELKGSLSQDDVIQKPTLPDNPQPRGLLMSVGLVVILTGLLVFIGSFVRAGLARASESPEGSAKVARIRRAFWLRPTPRTPSEGHPS